VDEPIFWFLFSGVLFSSIGVLHFSLKKSPITPSMIYLLCGVVAGPLTLGFLNFDVAGKFPMIERVTEIVVIISVFACGLKAKPRFGDRRWRAPLLLASVGMIVSIGLVSVVGYWLGLSIGAAIMLGSILAPTDPVLASAVQVGDEEDGDSLRFALTAEAGLNDGSAFPFLLLGLGLIGHHALGEFGSRWLLVDIVYKIVAAAIVGFIFAYIGSKLVVRAKSKSQDSFVLDEFFGLGLLFVSYGVCLALDCYGFVAAFVAGVIFRISERKELEASDEKPSGTGIIAFNENIEKVGEFVTIVFIGSLLKLSYFSWQNVVLALSLLFLIRPLSVYLSFTRLRPIRKNLAAWFGVRGVGSVFYLAYAVNKIGWSGEMEAIYEIVLVTIALSVLLHGATANPAMAKYSEVIE
jgi:sodium/hydrogen antiporter